MSNIEQNLFLFMKRIKEEAAHRRALREAAKAEKEASSAALEQKTPEQV